MQLKGRPRLALDSPGSLQLSDRHPAPGPCVLGPILSLRAPAHWPPGRPDQIQLCWQEGSEATPTGLETLPPGWQGGRHHQRWSLVLPLEQLLLAAHRRNRAGVLTVDQPCTLDRGSEATARLSSAVRSLRAVAIEGLSHQWLVLEPLLLELLVDALVASPSQSAPRQDRGWRHVIETLHCMEQGLSKDLSLADLSRATTVSPRALQMAFRRHLSKRPLQSLRELRLARLRQLLLQAGRRPVMADALRQCGLPGNGTTSRHYGDRYGEKPSQTRA